MTGRPVSRPDPTRSTWYPYPPGPTDGLGRLLEDDEYADGIRPDGCAGVLLALFGMVVIVAAIVAVAAALAP
jgi:hypothetical protein